MRDLDCSNPACQDGYIEVETGRDYFGNYETTEVPCPDCRPELCEYPHTGVSFPPVPTDPAWFGPPVTVPAADDDPAF